METLYRLPNYSRAAAGRALAGAVACLLLDLLEALSAAASWLAARWHQSPLLGPPLLRLASYPDRRLLATLGLLGVLAAAGAATVRHFRSGRSGPHARRSWSQGDPGLRGIAAALALAPTVLFPVLLAALHPLHSPLALPRWSVRFAAAAPLAHALAQARGLAARAFAALSAATLAFLFLRLASLRETGDTHGSSHWATLREVRRTGLLAAPGKGDSARPAVIAGAWAEPGGRLRALRDASDRHLLAVAPSGTGKSSCLVVPTLLEWPGSAIVLDIKGELWRLTAGYRANVLGQRCLRFDPSCEDGTAARYNPLLVIPRGAGEVKAAQAVADVLCDPEGRDRPRGFWEQSAHALLVGVLLHVLYAERDKTLAGCARLLSDPDRPVIHALQAMETARHGGSREGPEGRPEGWSEPGTGWWSTTHPTHPTVAAAARAVLDMDPRTASGVVATAQAHLDLFRDPLLAANTAASDFAVSDLVAGDRPATLYLTVPPGELDRLRGPLRLMLNQMARQLTGRLALTPEQARERRRPLLLLLDEFTALGRLDFFGRAMAYLRGYGIRVYLSIQSLAQLHEVYGNHQSISANCGLLVAFAPNDLETAELLSRMTGTMTVSIERRSLSGGPLALSFRRASFALHEVARPLLTSEEVRRLAAHEALVFAAGHPPIRARRLPFYLDPVAAERSRVPPPARSDRLAHDWSHWHEAALLPPAATRPDHGHLSDNSH